LYLVAALMSIFENLPKNIIYNKLLQIYMWCYYYYEIWRRRVGWRYLVKCNFLKRNHQRTQVVFVFAMTNVNEREFNIISLNSVCIIYSKKNYSISTRSTYTTWVTRSWMNCESSVLGSVPLYTLAVRGNAAETKKNRHYGLPFRRYVSTTGMLLIRPISFEFRFGLSVCSFKKIYRYILFLRLR